MTFELTGMTIGELFLTPLFILFLIIIHSAVALILYLPIWLFLGLFKKIETYRKRIALITSFFIVGSTYLCLYIAMCYESYEHLCTEKDSHYHFVFDPERRMKLSQNVFYVVRGLAGYYRPESEGTLIARIIHHNTPRIEDDDCVSTSLTEASIAPISNLEPDERILIYFPMPRGSYGHSTYTLSFKDKSTGQIKELFHSSKEEYQWMKSYAATFETSVWPTRQDLRPKTREEINVEADEPESS